MCSRSEGKEGAKDMELIMRDVIKELELCSSNEAINVLILKVACPLKFKSSNQSDMVLSK